MTTTTPKTSRVPGAFASVGAVAQTEGSLPVYRHNACGDEVVWATSKRTGRKYLVSVSYGYHGQRFYVGRNVHTCRPAEATADPVTISERAAEITAQVRAQVMAELAAGR